MIAKLDKNNITNDITIDKINEIIDFLNDTFLMKVKDNQLGTISVVSNDLIGFDDGETVLNNTTTTLGNVSSLTGGIKCPHCGASHYMESGGMSTCVYYPPIWKDGVNINPDRNTTTTYYKCLECGKEFYKEY
jgi:DNA-directed RNA polymerase subunit RPC12/RpoP